MQLLYECLFPAMWLAYILYWRLLARDVKSTERLEPSSSRWTRLALFLCASALLAIPHVRPAFLNQRFLPSGLWTFWLGAAVSASGFLLSIWARRYLGKNWSQAVTLKKDHELIITGPYSLVRHPIYTGLLLAFLGSAIARAEWRGLFALALIFIALLRKLTLEEKWMREHFGDSYEAYSRRVRALIPFLF